MNTKCLLSTQFRTISIRLVMIFAPIPLVPRIAPRIQKSRLQVPIAVALMIGNRTHAITPVKILDPVNEPSSHTMVLSPSPRLLKTNHLLTAKANTTPTTQERMLLRKSPIPHQRTNAMYARRFTTVVSAPQNT